MRAIRTTSQPRSRASTSTTPARSSDGGGRTSSCRGSSGRSPAGPVGVRDLQFLKSLTDRPVKATVPGPFTLSQQAQDEHYGDGGRSRSRSPTSSMPSCAISPRRAPTSSRSTSPGCSRARRRRGSSPSRPSTGRSRESTRPRCSTSAYGYAALVKEKHGQYGFLTELNDTVVDQISIEAAQPRLDLSVLAGLRQDDHPRRPRSRRPHGRDARDHRRTSSRSAGVRRAGAADRRAGLRDEVPPA